MTDEIVHHEGWVRLAPPWEAGKHDPPMQDWLQLPVGEDECPSCGSRQWGTRNPQGYFLVRTCHDEHGQGCRAQFRAEPTLSMLRDVMEALMGTPKRFAVSKPRHLREVPRA